MTSGDCHCDASGCVMLQTFPYMCTSCSRFLQALSGALPDLPTFLRTARAFVLLFVVGSGKYPEKRSIPAFQSMGLEHVLLEFAASACSNDRSVDTFLRTSSSRARHEMNIQPSP